MTITVPRVDARTVGALIALFERAVGLYASLVGINAYHQPGVEAGKKAAASVLALQAKVLAALSDDPQTAEQIAAAAGVAGRGRDGLPAPGTPGGQRPGRLADAARGTFRRVTKGGGR